MNLGGCVVCTRIHGREDALDGDAGGGSSVCKQCHEPGSAESRTAAAMAGSITKLDSSLTELGRVLGAGGALGDGGLRGVHETQDGRGGAGEARVAVHTLDSRGF